MYRFLLWIACIEFMVSTREIIFAWFWLRVDLFLKYLDFERILGQTSVPHSACIDKDEFGDF